MIAILLGICGGFTHGTAFVVLIIYLVSIIFKSKRDMMILCGLGLIAIFAYYPLMKFVFMVFPVLSSRFELLSFSGNYMVVLKSIPILLVFVYCIKNYDFLKKNIKNFNILCIFTFFMMFFWFFSLNGYWYYRLSMYMTMPFIVLVANILRMHGLKVNKYNYYIYLSIVLNLALYFREFIIVYMKEYI